MEENNYLWKEPTDIYNSLQDSVQTKVLVDIQNNSQFAANCIRNANHVVFNLNGDKDQDQISNDDLEKLTVEHLKTAYCSKYAWNDKECSIKDSKEWNNRGLMYKNVILCDTDGTSPLLFKIADLLKSEGKGVTVLLLKGGMSNFAVEYPFLISGQQKQKKALNGVLASEIYPKFLYIGGYENACKIEQLNALGITHILNVADELQNRFPDNFVYKHCGVNDTSADNISKYFEDSIKFIDEAKQSSSHKVLVHCAMGISRSSTIVIAWLMQNASLDFEAAKAIVKKKRSCISPNEGFVVQLKQHELELKNGTFGKH